MLPQMATSKGPAEARLAIDRFLSIAQQPALIEAGELPMSITAETFLLTGSENILKIECWSETRNLVRRVRGVREERKRLVELEVERFGAQSGSLTLIDLAWSANAHVARHGVRLRFRERFRRALRRQFPNWRLAELSTEPDLQHSLSPSFPRAFLRKGGAGLAAIGAAEDAFDPDGALSFGLIWLDYLRKRDPQLTIEGLAIFLPAGAESNACHRVRYLDPKRAQYFVFVHSLDGHEDGVDPRDYTNFSTRLDACRQPLSGSSRHLESWVERLALVDGVQRRNSPDGSVSLAVHGLEFARAVAGTLTFGIDRKHAALEEHLPEIERLASELVRMRGADAADRTNPLYLRHPEVWLEAQVRANLERIDAMLLPDPVYGQAPQFASGERSIIDLLVCSREGKLVVIEVKADQDIHLPLQALDYWMRVKWHLERDEFQGRGYFPGIELCRDPPRLLLVAPALEFHPSNETILGFLSPEVEVIRIGVGLEWRKELRVVSNSCAPYARRRIWPS